MPDFRILYVIVMVIILRPMKIFKKSTLFVSATLASLFTLAGSAAAQIAAHDDAAAYNGSTWTNNANQGFGFTPWTLLNVNVGGGFSGFYIGNPGNIGTSGNSFGMYANSGSSNVAAAFRGFSAPLTTNQVFKIKWETYGIGFSTASRGGFSLRNGNAATTTDDVGTGSRFDFYYLGNSGVNSFLVQDGTGVTAVGVPFTSAGLSLEFTLHADDTYRFVIKDASGSTILGTVDGQALAGSGTIDSVAMYAANTGGDQNFNSLEISSTSLVPPAIANIQPTNGAVFVDPSTNNISFEVDSVFSTVSSNNTSLFLNGVKQTNLVFNTTGITNQLFVTNTTALARDTVYNGQIIAADANGNRITNNFTFNTWVTNLFFIEAEDYNYNAGSFIPNPFPNVYGSIIANATNGIDVFKPFPIDGGTNAYRPQDFGLVDLDAPPVSADVDHNDYALNTYSDYNLSFVQFGEWENYTRGLSNVTYDVYARMASLSGNPTMELDRIATPKATGSNQPLAALGTFVCPANTGGSQGYTFVPLKDFFSNPVSIRFPGTNTFRSTRIGGSYNFNYLLFVPNTNNATLTPYISAGFPFPGATAGPETIISFTIANRQTAVNPATIQLLLNSNSVTSGITLSNTAAGTVVSYIPPAFLASNSTNTLTAIFTDNGGTPVTVTNNWQFTVSNPQIISLPGTNAQPVAAGTTPGFAIHIVKAVDTAPDYDFPTTLARAEAQLTGSIIDTNTTQPYPNLAVDGGGTNFFADTGTINFDITGAPSGSYTFPTKAAFPYVPAGGTNNFIAMAAEAYLQLAPGSYNFLVRSDDGFQLSSGITTKDTNIIVGAFDGGRGNDNPTTMYVNVLTNGLYPIRLLYLQAKFGGSVEFYSLNRAQGNKPILINDPSDPNSIKAFQGVISSATPVNLFNAARSGTTASFSFLTQSGRTHFVEYKSSLASGPWTPLITITGNGSVTNVSDINATNTTRFYRVGTQ
ncbi:MAG: hypothetical protein JWR19_1665 [Pedosphaera sp.]|nr:hypothetical protein [Pedosphaera sp.]